MTAIGLIKGKGKKSATSAVVPDYPFVSGPMSQNVWLAVASANWRRSPTSLKRSHTDETALPEALFDALAGFKVRTATLANQHLTKEERNKLFKQLDSLFDVENWDSTDIIATEASFVTLLRLILFLGGRRPGLGLTSKGNFIASWTEGDDRLTLECRPFDHVRWVLVQGLGDQRETAAGEINSVRLPEVLAPYDAPKRWFADAVDKAAT